MSASSVLITVKDATAAGEARRAASTLAGRVGLGEDDLGRLALIVTEMATNVVRHAGTGQLVLSASRGLEPAAVTVLALDRGPGMDVDRCLADGYSTFGGSAGTGLGAMRRQADEFDAYSTPRAGAALVAVVRARGVPDGEVTCAVGAIELPYPGEDVCGDRWAVVRKDGRIVFLVADGLGHGPGAAHAAGEMTRVLDEARDTGPAELLRRGHAELHRTRGAAVSVAELDPPAGRVRFAGVGNVTGVLLSGFGRQNMLVHNGIVGHEMRRADEHPYDWPRDGLLVMHSDGLGTRWNLPDYPGLIGRHPALIAGVLVRDHRRERDDVTVLVARLKGAA